MTDLVPGIVIGVTVCAVIVAVIEFRPKLRHKLRGNYFDARAPFEIARVGGPIEERSDARIDKFARRLGKLRERKWSDAGANE